MEEHPVPHNVLEIEFKLFGSFSVRQFARILAGCAVALLVYILKLPDVIALPVMLISIAFGAASAMIPNFDAKASTVIAAIFVSPRYIWQRRTSSPQYLIKDYQSGVVKSAESTPSISQATKKVNVNDAEIDQILNVRAQRRSQPLVEQQAAPTKLSDDFAEWHPNAEASESFAGNYAKEFAIDAQAVRTSPTQAVQVNTVKSEPIARPLSGQSVMGLVVDAAGTAVGGAIAQVLDKSGNKVFESASDASGKFNSPVLPNGQYRVIVQHQGYKFDDFDITVGDSKLPAYRFRAK